MSEHTPGVGDWLPFARSGSAEALGKILDACRGYLLTIASQELDPELQAKGGASDLVQETLLRAVRGFSGFQGDTEAELLAWLRRVLLNNLADFARLYRATDKRQVAREIGLASCDSSEPRGAELAADISSPSGQAMRHEQIEAVKKAMERLPEDYPRVLLLRYQDERSFDEIGRLIDRTANAARKLWLRAVERLQHELNQRHE
jgi:RNA polymerase sigma-70 factor (ECF subfamily)